MSGIYKITCLGNNKCYIGSSRNINVRWRQHKCSLRENKHDNRYLQAAWNKYGEDNFIFEILEECIDGFLEKEIQYININNSYIKQNGFNIQKPGFIGKERPEDFKKFISNLHKGRILTEEHKRKLRINNPNKKLSDENILEILQLIKNGMSNRNISKIYNVTETRISEIKHNKRFKHVKRPS